MSLDGFRLRLQSRTNPESEKIYTVTAAGHAITAFLWFLQNLISAGADWTACQYVQCMQEVCRLLRRCACDCVIVSVIVCVRAAIRTMVANA